MSGALSAHELWIEPLDFTPVANGLVAAKLVNGEFFDGVTLAYFPNRIARFDLYLGDMTTPVENRMGSSPALMMRVPGEGLVVAAYQSQPSRLAYDDWETFVTFTEHKDLGDAAALQAARGFAEADVTEGYVRFSKSLIGVGGAAGSDLIVGFEAEIVALANPYTDDLTGGFPVQLWYQGALLPDFQIEVFARAPDGTITDTVVRTDADGTALVPVTAGVDYMLDAVILREPTPALLEGMDVMWESLWANLTFAVPE